MRPGSGSLSISWPRSCVNKNIAGDKGQTHYSSFLLSLVRLLGGLIFYILARQEIVFFFLFSF